MKYGALNIQLQINTLIIILSGIYRTQYSARLYPTQTGRPVHRTTSFTQLKCFWDMACFCSLEQGIFFDFLNVPEIICLPKPHFPANLRYSTHVIFP